MHTLTLIKKGVRRRWLLNTNISDDLIDNLVNSIIDNNESDDWFIEEGFVFDKNPPLY